MMPIFVALLALIIQDPPVFRAPVRLIEVPAIVTDSRNAPIRNLPATELAVFDNDRPQVFHLDYTDAALSIVIAVQTNTAVRAWLQHVRRVGSLVDAILAGARGDVSVISFSDNVGAVHAGSEPLSSLKPGGDQSRCLDAVMAAVNKLKQTPADHRRVLLLIAQPGDVGSSATLPEVAHDLEANNITTYTLAMPGVGKDVLSNIRIGGAPGEGGGVVVGINLSKIVPEIYRGLKSTTGPGAVSILSGYSGGRIIPFRNLRELESGLTSVAEELHTSYVLTYSPDRPDFGYHRIRVELRGHSGVVRARPGYYLAPDLK